MSTLFVLYRYTIIELWCKNNIFIMFHLCSFQYFFVFTRKIK